MRILDIRTLFKQCVGSEKCLIRIHLLRLILLIGRKFKTYMWNFCNVVPCQVAFASGDIVGVTERK